MGPRSTPTSSDRLPVHRDRQARGRALVIGGGRPAGLDGGHFVEPTIFDGVTPSMRIFKEEIFGPVLAVSTARSVEEALPPPTPSSTASPPRSSPRRRRRDALRRRGRDRHGPRQRAHRRRRGAAPVRRHQGDRRRRARDVGGRARLLHRDQDRVHQLLGQRRTFDDSLAITSLGVSTASFTRRGDTVAASFAGAPRLAEPARRPS